MIQPKPVDHIGKRVFLSSTLISVLFFGVGGFSFPSVMPPAVSLPVCWIFSAFCAWYLLRLLKQLEQIRQEREMWEKKLACFSCSNIDHRSDQNVIEPDRIISQPQLPKIDVPRTSWLVYIMLLIGLNILVFAFSALFAIAVKDDFNPWKLAVALVSLIVCCVIFPWINNLLRAWEPIRCYQISTSDHFTHDSFHRYHKRALQSRQMSSLGVYRTSRKRHVEVFVSVDRTTLVELGSRPLSSQNQSDSSGAFYEHFLSINTLFSDRSKTHTTMSDFVSDARFDSETDLLSLALVSHAREVNRIVTITGPKVVAVTKSNALDQLEYQQIFEKLSMQKRLAEAAPNSLIKWNQAPKWCRWPGLNPWPTRKPSEMNPV